VSAVPPLPALPRDASGPIFAEPWQAQAFAMAVALHERGVFTWPEWAEQLAVEIKAAQARGEPDDGRGYYDHWLRALEALVVARGAATAGELDGLRHAWDRAARATPHGRPIELGTDPMRHA
jgi:nitrile hydratase accessory protein